MKILIIDDNEFDREIVCRYLSKAFSDIQITECDQANSGLQALANENFDCLLLDYRLPDLNGLEVLKKLQTENLATQCAKVLLTGDSADPVVKEALNLGAGLILSKDDYSVANLKNAIELAIEKLNGAPE